MTGEDGTLKNVHRGHPEKCDVPHFTGPRQRRKTDGCPNIKARQSKGNLNHIGAIGTKASGTFELERREKQDEKDVFMEMPEKPLYT